MRRPPVRVGIGVSIAVVIGLAALTSPAPTLLPTVRAADEKRDRWEYAELGRESLLDFTTGRVVSNTITWEGPDGARHSADDYADLSERMGLKKIKTNDSTAILNALGEEGWELVSHALAETATVTRGETTKLMVRHVWTFKRRK
jgi:hypothetical protein